MEDYVTAMTEKRVHK